MNKYSIRVCLDVDRQITAASLEIVNAEKRLASTFELWCSTTTAEDEVSEGRSVRVDFV